jgi:hypothetical protein
MITQEGSDFQIKRLLKPYIYAQKDEQEGLQGDALPAHQIMTAFVSAAIRLRKAQ